MLNFSFACFIYLLALFALFIIYKLALFYKKMSIRYLNEIKTLEYKNKYQKLDDKGKRYIDSVNAIAERMFLTFDARRANFKQIKQENKLLQWVNRTYCDLQLGEIGALVQESNHGAWMMPLNSSHDVTEYEQAQVIEWFDEIYNSTEGYHLLNELRLTAVGKDRYITRGDFLDWQFDIENGWLIITCPKILCCQKGSSCNSLGRIFILNWPRLKSIIVNCLESTTSLNVDIIRIISFYWLGISNL